MPNIDEEIRSKTQAFVSNLTDLIKRAALESVSTALGSTRVPIPPAPVKVAARRGPGRPKKVVASAAKALAPAAKSVKAAPASKAAPFKKAPPKRPFGAKRPPDELAKLTETLGEYVKAHPGLRIEPISRALGAPTKELNLPIKKLIAANKIRSEGHKRATEYFPA